MGFAALYPSYEIDRVVPALTTEVSCDSARLPKFMAQEHFRIAHL